MSEEVAAFLYFSCRFFNLFQLTFITFYPFRGFGILLYYFDRRFNRTSISIYVSEESIPYRNER